MRELEPQKTFDRLSPILFEKFGITRVANVTGLDCIGVPVYIAIRPNSKCLAVSQGKGIMAASAKVSAVMESIETFYAENISTDAIQYVSTIKDIPSSKKACFGLFIDDILMQDVELSWLNCKNIIDNEDCLLPKEKLSLDTTQFEDKHKNLKPSSNGLASGNTRDEAICHSLCELIERDAVAKWFLLADEQQNNLLIDLETIHCTFILDLISRIKSKGLKLFVWDITSNINIPTFYCAVADDTGVPYTLFSGHGTHYDKTIALSRAITEACQARLTYISGSRDDIYPEFYNSYDPTLLVEDLMKVIPTKKFLLNSDEKIFSFKQLKIILLEELVRNNIRQVYMYEHTTLEYISVVQVVSPELMENE